MQIFMSNHILPENRVLSEKIEFGALAFWQNGVSFETHKKSLRGSGTIVERNENHNFGYFPNIQMSGYQK